ncbi:uncharacterized protein LOC110115819 [Dendrobium catenatum]|uniref:RNA exonuclease 4 n=1 Tax=Dendrobium catenatum TaxID=906689 RepID=A0A2I0VMK8_9ASPA|nr:uncharacterized protein LOC110115819 [Dendrobium catenatum]PKU64637.1 Small RNA degrading nuclease 1 [Dendrobium catenatum]
METMAAIPNSESRIIRHKCSACFKQYNKKEHLIEHMKASYHSAHQPKCVVCKKYCKTLESVREHLTGPLAKNNCACIFASLGCNVCLKMFNGSDDLIAHRSTCCLDPASFPGLENMYVDHGVRHEMEFDDRVPKVIALDCEMVGGGSDGSLDVCARVCLIDLNEDVIFHSYVKPIIPVTDYRYETTGISEDYLVNAMPIGEVQKKVLEILYNGEESISRIRLYGGKACLLVGHSLDNDLDCLRINYPDHLIRDSAKYVPLLKTNLVSHSLKYLTRTYLGYEIQSGAHDPYEDCVAALRLYKRLRSQEHPSSEVVMHENGGEPYEFEKRNNFDLLRVDELLKKSPDELLMMSTSNYRCWCLDGGVLC